MNIDFDSIALDIMDVLDHYDINYKNSIIHNKIVPAWYKAKKPLLEVFSRHPNWNDETLSVLFETQYERELNRSKVRGALTDVAVYTSTPGGETRLDDGTAYKKAINSLYWNDINTPTITPDNQGVWIETCKTDNPKRLFPVGLRTSKAFDRFFKFYGADKHPHYNKFFAVLADAVSPLKVTRTTCLSFHPCDYLLMSRGTGWHSCHMIDGGGWQGGTWSYMLDNVSSIFYTTEDKNDEMYWRTKVNRMVTCFQGKEILFSRLYPSCGDKEMRHTFRQIIQEIYAQCLGIPNMWQKPMNHRLYSGNYQGDDGYWYYDCDRKLIYSGNGHMQYEDYDYAEWGAELSIAADAAPTKMYIGTWGICPETGDEYDDHAQMTSIEGWACGECGCHIRYEDDVWYDEDGNAYCYSCFHDMFTECAECGEWCRNETMHETDEGEQVCNWCYDRYYTTCTWCGRGVHEDYAIVDNMGRSWCRDCADECLTRCDECDEYFRNNEMKQYGLRDLCASCYEDVLEEEAEAEEEVEVNA